MAPFAARFPRRRCCGSPMRVFKTDVHRASSQREPPAAARRFSLTVLPVLPEGSLPPVTLPVSHTDTETRPEGRPALPGEVPHPASTAKQCKSFSCFPSAERFRAVAPRPAVAGRWEFSTCFCHNPLIVSGVPRGPGRILVFAHCRLCAGHS